MNIQLDLLIIDRIDGRWPQWAIDFVWNEVGRSPEDFLDDLYKAAGEARK